MTTKGLGLSMRIRNYTCVSEVTHNVLIVAWKRVKEQLKLLELTGHIGQGPVSRTSRKFSGDINPLYL